MTKKDKVTVNEIIGLVDCEPTDSVEEVRKLRGRTNERFECDKGSRIIIDNETKLHYIMTLDWECSLVTKLLNSFVEENEQLKKDCTVLIYHNQEYRKENEQLKADKQSLIDFIRKEFPKSHKHILEGFND